MAQTEEVKRIVPGTEMFFGESVAQYLAELADEAYYSGFFVEGLLLGKVFSDRLGQYVTVSGVTRDCDKSSEAVGWFSSSDSVVFTPGHMRGFGRFFKNKAYAILVDASRGEMATYSVEHGVARKIPSMIMENL